VQQFGERHGLGGGARHDHAATREDHRELRGGEQRRGFVQRCRVAGPAADAQRRGDRRLDVAVEIVARDVELHGPISSIARVEAVVPRSRPCASGLLTWPWNFVIFEKIGNWSFPGNRQGRGHRAGLGRDEHHRRVRPVGRGDRGDELVMPGRVLRDAPRPCRPEARA